jgi:hypothetical protein
MLRVINAISLWMCFEFLSLRCTYFTTLSRCVVLINLYMNFQIFHTCFFIDFLQVSWDSIWLVSQNIKKNKKKCVFIYIFYFKNTKKIILKSSRKHVYFMILPVQLYIFLSLLYSCFLFLNINQIQPKKIMLRSCTFPINNYINNIKKIIKMKYWWSGWNIVVLWYIHEGMIL